MRSQTLGRALAPVLLLLAACRPSSGPGPGPEPWRPSRADLSGELADLPEIRERGRLVVLTGYDAVAYFLYRGAPRGFEYELAESLGDELDLAVEYRVLDSIEEMFDALARGEGDLIAFQLTVTRERQARVAFTEHYTTTRQVLVQRKPSGWRKMPRHQLEALLIRDPVELLGKTVVVERHTAFVPRLRHLAEELGGRLEVVEAPAGTTTEQLIEAVHEGLVRYTVADENVARVQAAYFEEVDVGTALSLPQRIAWAVRPSSSELRARIDEWMKRVRKDGTLRTLYQRYYHQLNTFRRRRGSQLFSLGGGTISEYDSELRAAAESLGWDWRMLAALVYRESRFDPEAESWAGALGLMQLMPTTAAEFGASDPFIPSQNIAAGTRYLEWLQTHLGEGIEDLDERRKFVLGAYNAGIGHVEDARRLAEAFGADPDLWEGNVAAYLERKSDPQYFRHAVVRYGFCRGRETTVYVEEIFRIYRHYKNLVG